MYLSLFCFSMLNLVLADNLFQVFVSWELVGICSFLLIGFYYERHSASTAANKAFITNRVGDAGFILGLLIVWSTIGTFNFQELFGQIRAPRTDSHGDAVQLGGRIVRAEPLNDNPGRLRITPDGSQVVLYPRTPPGHFHPVDEGDEVSVARPGAYRYSSMPYWLLTAAGLGIFLGCVGKSAQFPLQVWLPDAMEGPTPVSALIHAATMVAAGVYLVGRCYPLFTPEALLVIAYTGGITLFVAATIAVVMTDIKKVLAYSTVSQLGYMMLALGVGGWEAGLFHLMTHAFFKAQLFLGSGSVIYGCHHEQDMSRMGGLLKKMPITGYTMLLAVLAIAGVPLFSGWHSKDAILAAAWGFMKVQPAHTILFVLPLVTAGLTTFYMFRMWFLTFTGAPRDHHVYDHAHETPWTMTAPLVVLGILSVVVSWGLPPFDAKESWLGHTIKESQPYSVRADFGHVEDPFNPHHSEAAVGAARPAEANARQAAHEGHDLAGLLALAAVALGVVFAAVIYRYGVLDPAEAKEQFPGVFDFLAHKWYFDELYSAMLVRPALVVGRACRWFDLTVIDGLIHGVARSAVAVSRWDGWFDNRIVDGLVNLLRDVAYGIGAWLRGLQTGYLRSYVLFLVLAAAGIYVVLSYFVALATAG
jgi:NADH-quinone oxidoreductase subunit L